MIAAALISETVDRNILIGLFAGFGVYAILGFPFLSDSYLDIESLAIAIWKFFNRVGIRVS